MLSSMLKEHQSSQQARKAHQEKILKEAVDASNRLTEALVDHLNVGVAQAYLNQKRLDNEACLLEHNALTFARNTSQWLNMISSFTTALKEVGDVQNWVSAIESDLQMISSTLEFVYKAEQETTSETQMVSSTSTD